ncbi:MAG: site-specific DNA-methyltransferase [Cryobacterium sp.]|nr:site-specific DNA-methyltransferase [Cryobacterium sp.]
MAHIDALIDKISDPSLRQALRDQIDILLNKQLFGLVFQPHKPETVELPYYKVRRGCKVRYRAMPDSDIYQVTGVDRGEVGIATIVTLDEACTKFEAPISELVVVREFGEPVYPGVKSVGKVHRGGSKPSHVVINAENFHALETLIYTHEDKVDAIYIDPPYNSGARTWKYNNDYVDAVDQYRHSKWLSFMEKRLNLAKRLLNPQRSVLIVTIDENEVHRLALLLNQIFPTNRTQTVTSVINPKGASLGGDFARVDEYIFFVYIGDAAVQPGIRDMLNDDVKREKPPPVKWSSLIRGGAQGIRTDSPGAYYPVFVDAELNTIHSFGDALPPEKRRESVKVPRGTIAVWPPTHTSGVEGRWGIGPDKAYELYQLGALRLGKIDVAASKFPMSYLSSGIVDKIMSGEITIVDTKDDGTLKVKYADNTLLTLPRTVWRSPAHNAGEYGSKIISQLLPGRRFPFPKALYAVEDTLRFFVGNNRDAVIVDFFGGSGTTVHAVARLNHEDEGRRQCILITNNEMSDAESKALSKKGLFPGDDEWEALGVCHYITIPRITAAFTGRTPAGVPVEFDYKFNDEFPMSDGLDENVEFFELTYEDPDLVSLGRKFAAIAPLLWLKAGGRGACIDKVSTTWELPEDGVYCVLFDNDRWREFVDALNRRNGLTHAYVVTDSESTFQQIVAEMPTNIIGTQLYGDYLRTFEINTKGRV